MMLAEDAVVGVVRAELVSDYRLKLSFSDRVERIVDFGPFLRNSRNPLIRAYLDPAKFADFQVQDGDLIWDDYGLCFPVADLYENRL